VNAAIDELGRAGVATVYEAYGRRGLIEQEWHVITPGRRVAGPARTVLCGHGDNRAVHEAMDRVQPGEILVITMDSPAPFALVGDLLATQAAAQGAVGMLVDAAVRDTAELAGGQLAILARWRNARGATKVTRGALDLPITVGGCVISTGDVVVLDEDGATAVEASDVPIVVDAVRARITKEADLRARWANGELSYDAYGLRDEDLRRSTAS
jgi:4-hydroxy-4-methyl-2-oxoglutarate aldolase